MYQVITIKVAIPQSQKGLFISPKYIKFYPFVQTLQGSFLALDKKLLPAFASLRQSHLA